MYMWHLFLFLLDSREPIIWIFGIILNASKDMPVQHLTTNIWINLHCLWCFAVAWTWCWSPSWLQGSDELLPPWCLCFGWYWPSHQQVHDFRCLGVYCSHEEQVYFPSSELLHWYLFPHLSSLLHLADLQFQLPSIFIWKFIVDFHGC